MRPRFQLLLATGLILSANVVRAAVITLTVGPTGQFASINAATSFADTDANPNNSYDILVAPGTYINDFSNVTRPMTIEAATPGSQVLLLATVPPPNLKGIIWTDSSLTVNGLTFKGLRSQVRMAAMVRGSAIRATPRPRSSSRTADFSATRKAS